MTESDHEILARILAERGRFGHREHLELAWNLLGKYGREDAQMAAADALRHLARKHGMPNRYHETITASWVHLVALHHAAGAAGSFDEFIAENPALLNSQLLEGHYSRRLLGSGEARARWVKPDLRAFPAAA
jgi:hypothetical protein